MANQFAAKGDRRFGTEQLYDAGASEAFVSMYLSASGGRRHSVQEELDSGYGGDVLADGDDPTRVAGGFFSKLWDGDVFDAFLHADGNNTPLMLEVFSPKQIRDHAVDEGDYSIDYATRMVNDRAERHGYDPLE